MHNSHLETHTTQSKTENTQGSFTFVMIPVGGENAFQEVTRPKASLFDDELEKYARVYFGFSDDSVCACMRMCVLLRLQCLDIQGNTHAQSIC